MIACQREVEDLTNVILGAGVTGLAAGLASGWPVYEAEQAPGGICSSYYLGSGNVRTHNPPARGECYRFELGGGHWIFGGERPVIEFIHSLAAVKRYSRRSAVFFPDGKTLVPYPIQNHLKHFDCQIADKALREMATSAIEKRPSRTMAEWLQNSFGPTLCDLFFSPFHELYTAGLWKSIAPQDAYKSPVNLSLAIQGAFNHTNSVGYNTTFIYPVEGLNAFTQRMAERCDLRYGKRVVRIDAQSHKVFFADGTAIRYDRLISSLPLNRMMALTALEVGVRPDPSPSVLVINIGAQKGTRCPTEHWVYLPSSNCGFHRVGFYSNVDPSFLPASARGAEDRVSIYVEKAYPESQRPSQVELGRLCRDVVEQLQVWEWISDVEVIDPTWIEVAYTWSWSGSKWKDRALEILEQHEILQVGRYACWSFQGIADSIRDGLLAGAALSGAKSQQMSVASIS